MEVLSSDVTVIYKYLLPFLWPIILVIAIIGMLPGFPLIIWLIAEVTFVWFALKLKGVRLLSDHLVVKDFRKRIDVHLSNIEQISEFPFGHVIILTLRTESLFGKKIYFIPKLMYFRPWNSHPVTRKLREAVHNAN